MKKYTYNQLSILQYILLIHGAQVGIGVLTIPRELAEKASTDGWISLLIGWLAATLVSLVITNMMKQYPEKTIIDIFPLILGKWLGRVAIALMSIYCGIAAFVLMINATGIINVWLLSQTPAYVVVFLFALPTYLVLQGGLRAIGRYAELVFYLTLWIPFVLTTAYREVHWLNLLPVIKDGWHPIWEASKSTVLSFLGFEFGYFAYPFLQKKEYASLGIVIANTLTMLVYMSVTIVCFAYFSPDEITQYTWPTLNLWKAIEFRFLERVDILFLSSYLFILSTTALPYIYFCVFSFSQLFGMKDHRKHLRLFLLLVPVAVWFYTPSFIDLKKSTQIWSYTGLGFAYVLPLLAWVLIRLSKRTEGEEKA
ncbi:endospore germination permease [Brevibacillus sp. BC25]|uniref:GerAB/ArcD/ProY family transporter n=1 Tax=Brevibacillus sp. BC25 TaxID=1144308 RepID=UPI0002710BB8|nr:endospore germination permease [Brevibacillus sp. BC25]EJL23549.1 spore germination protein, amino acid permease [Brevibacillus sp. BC25]